VLIATVFGPLLGLWSHKHRCSTPRIEPGPIGKIPKRAKAMNAETEGEKTLNSLEALQVQVECQSAARERAEALLHSTRKRLDEANNKLEHQLFIKNNELSCAQGVGGFGTFTVDLERKLTTWSEGFYRVLELDPESTPPALDVFISILHEDDRQEFASFYRKKVDNKTGIGHATRLQHRIRRKSGAIRWLDSFAVITYDPHHGAPIVFGAIHDITEKKIVEEALEASDLMVTKRVLELEEAQRLLSIARDEAESERKEKVRFLAMVSKKSSLLLDKLLASLDLLRDPKTNKTESACLDVTFSIADKLTCLVTNAIDWATLENEAEITINETSFNISELIENACETARPIAKRKGLRLKHDISLPPAENQVVGDVNKIHQLLNILIINAIEYTHEGEITISLDRLQKLRLTEEQEILIKLTVSDTGLGIAPEDQERIFTEFITLALDDDTKDEVTGLGLSIFKKLVTSMKGQFGLESEPDVGSKFWCALPLLLDSPSSDSLKKLNNLDEIKTKLNQSPRILLAEDNAANQMVATKMLERFGCQIDITENGNDALQAIVKQNYDLILMDVSMPVMDGLTATRHIRNRTDARSKIPIVGFTGYVFTDDIQRCLDAGMDEVISKPLVVEELHDAIQVALIKD
jgi:PAS domain S-box-containing protein